MNDTPTYIRTYNIEVQPGQEAVIDIVKDNGNPATFTQILNGVLGKVGVIINGYNESTFLLGPLEGQTFQRGDLLVDSIKIINLDANTTANVSVIVTVKQGLSQVENISSSVRL